MSDVVSFTRTISTLQHINSAFVPKLKRSTHPNSIFLCCRSPPLQTWYVECSAVVLFCYSAAVAFVIWNRRMQG